MSFLKQSIDLRGKRVLDLGCSGGAFSIGLADKAELVLGIDADPLVIGRARERARAGNVENVSFRCAVISPELIDTLPRFDVTLFLSVFHHMLTDSDAYAWNQNEGINPWVCLERIKRNTDVFVFEMGMPDEGYEWCERLPEMIPDPDSWIRDRVIGDRFEHVKRIEAPALQGPCKTLHGIGRKLAAFHPLLKRGVKRFLRFDVRDQRPLYLAGGREARG